MGFPTPFSLSDGHVEAMPTNPSSLLERTAQTILVITFFVGTKKDYESQYKGNPFVLSHPSKGFVRSWVACQWKTPWERLEIMRFATWKTLAGILPAIVIIAMTYSKAGHPRQGSYQ